MSAISKIEWTDATWNPTRGCSIVSAGCTNCYAMKQGHRFSGPGKPYEGLTRMGANGPTWTGKVRIVPEALDWPLRYRGHPKARAEGRPTRIFVNSMSDLFHPGLTNGEITAVFGAMTACPQHEFQVLTKRPEQIPQWFSWIEACRNESRFRHPEIIEHAAVKCDSDRLYRAANDAAGRDAWPLPNVWLGVSVEDQATADERIPLLLQTPAAVRFVSYEPALGPVQFGVGGEFFDYGFGRDGRNEPRVHWLIVGGESGPRARPCDVEWIRSAVRQCREAGVAVFVKQMGARPIVPAGRLRHWEWGGAIGEAARFELTDPLNESTAPWFVRLRDRKGGDWSEWPEDLRVREFPTAVEAGEVKDG